MKHSTAQPSEPQYARNRATEKMPRHFACTATTTGYTWKGWSFGEHLRTFPSCHAHPLLRQIKCPSRGSVLVLASEIQATLLKQSDQTVALIHECISIHIISHLGWDPSLLTQWTHSCVESVWKVRSECYVLWCLRWSTENPYSKAVERNSAKA